MELIIVFAISPLFVKGFLDLWWLFFDGLEPGDYVDHPKFKRCRVARVEGDMEYVQVKLRNGNIVRLSLDIVTLVLVGSEDGHQVFEAIIDA